MKSAYLCLILILAIAGFSSAAVIRVPGDYPTIQEAIDAAVDGDTVSVAEGTYEENIVLKSNVDVIGIGAEMTTITASEGNVVTADTVAEVTLEGFTIDGQDSGRYGIYCVNTEPSVKIHGNIIMNIWGDGIYCYYSSPTISNNIITEIVFDGIYLNWSGPSIISNIITYVGTNGIHSEVGTHNPPYIKGNTIKDTGGDGVFCHNDSSPLIEDNIITQTGDHGIECHNSSSPVIRSNEIIFSLNDGVNCNGKSRPKLRGNLIHNNSGNGVFSDAYSLPNLGTDLNPGLNEIFSNGKYDVYSENTAEIKAELNWWGQAPPNPVFFSGNIDYDPWLTEPPSPNSYPSISAISPNAGTTAGGTRVTIIGHHFADDVMVTFGINSAANVEFISETELKATTPANVAGAVDVIVTNPDGQSATLENGFFYVDISCPLPGDVSGDGTISAYDAALILQFVIGLIDTFPVDSPIVQAAQKFIDGKISIEELDKILQAFGYPSVLQALKPETKLLPNYPNPFNPETWIPYQLATDSPVTITIYDIKGQMIRTISFEIKRAGVYTTKDKAAYWNGKNTTGEKVTSGIYWYTLRAGEFSATRRMVILK